MALPDTFERIGIVLGTVLLGIIATSPLAGVMTDFGTGAVFVGTLVVAGVGGWLIATDRVRVPYTRAWRFAIVTMLGALALYALAGLNDTLDPQPVEGVALWLVAAALGALVAGYDRVLARLR
ncbi:hypothetical protein [Salarchaeum sp. JOR-1]|uniref:hypothetical protein n=1 Tax=Salarchaeum sp. JOR-1 TaxID=2599399 RepID=UPI001198AD96|nr:hypothetical protein [Salarchaeum sp. JOR-1]QDX40110.1 hypothetical protein FQU85_04090 [Salarchaeum sp. JOR-1]